MSKKWVTDRGMLQLLDELQLVQAGDEVIFGDESQMRDAGIPDSEAGKLARVVEPNNVPARGGWFIASTGSDDMSTWWAVYARQCYAWRRP